MPTHPNKLLSRIASARRLYAHARFLFIAVILLNPLQSFGADDSTGNFDGAKYPPRLKRSESFLGIHYDFHAGPDCKEIGKNTTRAMVENIIDQVHPDYIQIDCKGHRGMSSYPTKVGNQAPGFVGDPLRIWRQVTAERGVALYMHYSGVWDSEAIVQNPSWAAIKSDGKPNDRATSFFSPYADKLLIPQLRELAGVYGVDGVWVDGECWASVPDYGEAALKAFREQTGITDIPRKPSDPHWYEFLQFNRELFRKYLRHYITEVKKTHPDFQICSNWAFTDHMPEPVCVPVDFLSGDYSPDDSVNSARLSARYLARQGLPWDLMAWSFSRKTKDGVRLEKPAVQLMREAAVVLALGGGFQAYFKQKRDGSVYAERVPVMAEVARFCRARQELCHRAEMVPQVALLFSTAANYRRINGLFNRDLVRINGTLQALLEGQQSVEVLGEHHLAGRMSQYPLIVVPEWEYLEPRFKQELLEYVRAGGNLLLIGPKAAQLFQTSLEVLMRGKPEPKRLYLSHNGALMPTTGLTDEVTLGRPAESFGKLHEKNDVNSPSRPAASITALDKGKIAATYFDFGQGYVANQSEVGRQFLNDLVWRLFPEPIVEVQGSHDVDVSVARNHGKLLVNLVNTAGPHREAGAIDSIPPVGPLQITVRTPEKPARVTLEPGGESLPFIYAGGQAKLSVPSIKIHRIIAFHEE